MVASNDIAVIGISGRFPGCANIEELLCQLMNDGESLGPIKMERLVATGLPLDGNFFEGGFLDNVHCFDHRFFGIARGEAEEMDPHHRISLETAYLTFENAGLTYDRLSNKNIAVIVSDIGPEYYRIANVPTASLVTGNDKSFLASRIARHFNLSGSLLAIDSSCSSGLVALHQACNELRLEQAEAVLVVSVYLNLFPFRYTDVLGTSSKDGKSKPFSANANGMSHGEAAVGVLIKRLSHAVSAGDPILAVIKGSAVNNNGKRSSSLTAPESESIAEVITTAWRRACVDPKEVQYIEAHGSGTFLGDTIEVAGLNLAFRQFTDETSICAISTLKSNIGHTRMASGLCGLVKVILSLQNRKHFASLSFDQPNPYIDFSNSQVYVNDKLREWTANAPRLAGVTAMGLNGTNCHMVIAEAPVSEPVDRHGSEVMGVFPISAKTEWSLKKNIEAFRAFLISHASLTKTELMDVSYTMLCGRNVFEYRHVFTGNARENVLSQIDSFSGKGVRQRVDQCLFILYDSIDMDIPMVSRYNSFAPFKSYYDDCLAACLDEKLIATREFRIFAFQFSFFQLLKSYGFTKATILAIGKGRIIRDAISEKITLSDAIHSFVREKNEDPGNFPQKINHMLNEEIKQNQVLFLSCDIENVFFDQLQKRSATSNNIHFLTWSKESTPFDVLVTFLSEFYVRGLPWKFEKWGNTNGGRFVSCLPSYSFELSACWLENSSIENYLSGTMGLEEASHSDPGAPRNEWSFLQKAIGDEWEKILKVKIPSLESNFFELGGDSLGASKLIQVVNSEFQLDLGFEDAFDFPTLGEFSRHVFLCLSSIDKIQVYWIEILKDRNVGLDDDFFSLGGHSLLANQILNRINGEFNVSLSFDDFFESPTIRSLSALIDRRVNDGAAGIPLAPLGRYDVSSSQRRFWVIDQLGDSREVYNSPIYLRLKGDLDIAGVEHSFRLLVERHESLRTVFDEEEGVPVQRVLEYSALGFRVEHIDLSGEVSSKEKTVRIHLADMEEGFDLRKGPLIRVKLMRITSSDWHLLINIHHIVTDGWSDQVIARDLISLYNSYKRGMVANLPALRIQYKDFTYWQNQILEGSSFEEHREYWKSQLEVVWPRVTVPEDYPRPPVKTYHSVNYVHGLEPGFVKDLNRYGESQGLSLFMLLVAGLKVLLHRYSGEEDIVIGTPVSGRNHRDLEDQVGLYINTIVLRTEIKSGDDFDSVCRKVKETCLSGYRHQVYPFEKLVEEHPESRDVSRSPLFDILVVSHDLQMEEDGMAMDGLEITQVITDFSVNKFDLSIYFHVRSDQGAYIQIGYNTDLYSEEHIERMSKHYVHLLHQMMESGLTRISDHHYLTEEEQDLLRSFNDTGKPYDEKTLLHELMEKHAAAAPSRVALRFEGSSLSYGELNQRSNELAYRLKEQGLTTGEGVSLLTARGFEMIIGMFGILKAGCYYVPIDTKFPIERQRYIVDNSGVRYLVTDGAYTISSEASLKTVTLSVADPVSSDAMNPGIKVGTDSLAYIIYTSGSTGQPKGVMIEHHSVVNLIESLQRDYGINAGDKVLQITSMCFDLSVYDIFGLLSAGGEVVIASQEEIESLSGLCRLIETEGITFWDSVPSTMDHLLRYQKEEGLSGKGDRLRLVFLSGDWIAVNLPGRVKSRYENAAVISLGGATECTVWSNYYRVEEQKAEWKSIPYGRPLSNNYFYILDPNQRPVPVGVPGELYIGGVGVARGYAQDKEKTDIHFMVDPIHPHGRMYRTGDFGRMMLDGQMEFLGRKDTQIKIRGFRVELGEIENVLRNHEQVDHGIVVSLGERDARYLIGYYTGVPGIETQLQRHLKDHLPDYMLPSYLVHLDEFPLNVNGKISVKELPAPSRRERAGGKEKSPDQVEATLEGLWSEILGKKEIGLRDNFFELGGHSLGATRLIAKVNKAFQVKLTLRQIFTAPTIEDLATVIRNGRRGDNEPIPVSDIKDIPASFAQRRFWILSQFEEGSQAYHVSESYDVEGMVDYESLEESFGVLIQRYEILRTTLQLEEGVLYQRIRDHYPKERYYSYKDMVTRPEEDIEEHIQDFVKSRFELSEGPLVRIGLIKTGANRHRLIVVLHHIIADEWSMQILIKEFGQLYIGYIKKQPVELPALSLQYKDYSLWHNNRLKEEQMEIHRRYWLDKFSRPVEPLQLPTDYPRPEVKQYKGSSHTFVLEAEVRESLEALSRRHHTTLYVTLLAVVNAFLYRYTGQRDIVVGSPVAGRQHEDLSGQVGLYLNTIALRTELSGTDTFEDLLERTKETVIEAYDHQDYPFDKLLEDLHLKKDPSRSPLFDSWVVFLDGNMKDQFTISDLIFTHKRVAAVTSKFDLNFSFIRYNDQLQVIIEYDTMLFEYKTIQVFELHLVNWVKGILMNKDEPINSFMWSLKPINKVINNIEFNF